MRKPSNRRAGSRPDNVRVEKDKSTSIMNLKQTMINVLKALPILICANLLSLPALGAPVHVEIIVFSQNDKGADHEWFMRPETAIKVADLVDEDVTLSTTEATEQTEAAVFSFENLAATGPQPVEAFVLTKFAKTLEEHPDYEILNYVSWVQEPVPKSRTKSISLDIPLDDSILSDEMLLAGTTSVYEIAQLLQLDINITYKPAADSNKETVYLPESVSLFVPTVSYQLDERRQVQINDIHYFDHPKFGVVFTIIRPKPPATLIQ